MQRKLIYIIILSMTIAISGVSYAQEIKEEGEKKEIYIIKQGDTLWDISSKFLKNPFSWPKLWQRNPYITNPHWIYPGHPLRLSPLEEKKEMKEEPQKVVIEEKPKEELKEKEVKEVKKEEAIVEKKPSEEKPKETKPTTIPEIRSSGFVSDKEYKGIGIVLESREGKNLMSSGDIIYLAFKTSDQVLVGDKYTIFRASEVVKHPVTKKRIGIRYNIIGNVQVIDRCNDFYTAKVIESFDAIFKGDLIQPYLKEKMEVQ